MGEKGMSATCTISDFGQWSPIDHFPLLINMPCLSYFVSVPKKKGRLVGLGRRTRSVPPSSAPPPFVDPEVLTAQLKDKDDRISLLETQMAAQQAGYEAQRRLNQQMMEMMEMMQRMYPNEGLIPRNIPRDSFLEIFRGLRSSEIPNENSEELFVGTSEDWTIGKSIEISRVSSPSVYSEKLSDELVVLGISSEICFLGIPSENSEGFPRKYEFPRSYFRGLVSSILKPVIYLHAYNPKYGDMLGQWATGSIVKHSAWRTGKQQTNGKNFPRPALGMNHT
ncbi:hypothetical protein F2Q68_00043330 [Brassica cretica]|uniref:Uncharacterized protein n=1 Tax=Brassica cretica TaxID=69181 RepID=A0A8S9LG46_BRACR|nr:hypothetical protein F2Q68_00043330 [Brassica cretica]